MKFTHCALLAMAVLASGCEDEKSPAEKIIGTWNCEAESTKGNFTKIFNEKVTLSDDGTSESEVKLKIQSPEVSISLDTSMSTTWTMDKNIMVETITALNITNVKPTEAFTLMKDKFETKIGTKGSFKIDFVSDNEMTIDNKITIRQCTRE